MGRTIYLELVPSSRMANDLSAGGLFVQDKELAVQDPCTIVVFNDGGQLELPAKVVYCDGNGGVGLEVVGFGPEIRAQLDALLVAVAQGLDTLDLPGEDGIAMTSRATLDMIPDVPAEPIAMSSRPTVDMVADVQSDTELGEQSEREVSAELESGSDEEREEYKSLHVRLRGLNLATQIKRARLGDTTERMLLERMYGKNVWEPLLRNPKVTAPEVARIARMGALPRPLIEVIFSNGAWLQIPEIRRALLSNPRLGTDQIIRVLRLMPKHELKLAGSQTVYPFAVRDQAKRLIKESEK